MTANNLPTGVPDPGDEVEMKKCPHCNGSSFEDNDCEVCDSNRVITESQYDLYMSELKDDKDSNNS